MTDKHTPGPWLAEPTKHNIIVWSGETMICFIIGDGSAQANASLIAAAPDLLEAAKAALASSSLSESEPGGINILAVEAMLRAAIAKATGGTE